MKIIFKNLNGSCGVITPTAEALTKMTIEEIALKDVPFAEKDENGNGIEGTQLEYRIADESCLPSSRNYRNAWTDDNATETVDVDFEKAKASQLPLIIAAAHSRVAKDAWGNQDFTQVQQETSELDFSAAVDFDQLYNMWPASIERRQSPRTYVMHKPKQGD